MKSFFIKSKPAMQKHTEPKWPLQKVVNQNFNDVSLLHVMNFYVPASDDTQQPRSGKATPHIHEATNMNREYGKFVFFRDDLTAWLPNCVQFMFYNFCFVLSRRCSFSLPSTFIFSPLSFQKPAHQSPSSPTLLNIEQGGWP